MISLTDDVLALTHVASGQAVARDAPNWTEVTTAGIALLALVGAFIQLWSARLTTRRKTAFSYFERWSNPASMPYVAEMARLLKDEPDQDDRERLHEWEQRTHEERLASLLFVNFWEELGGLYNCRLVDREVIRQYLGAVIVAYWKNGQWFIRCGEEENPHMFEEWRKMSDDVAKWLQERDHPKCRRRMRTWFSKTFFGWL